MKIFILAILLSVPVNAQSWLLTMGGSATVDTGTVLLDSLKGYWALESDGTDSYSTNNLTNYGVAFVAGKVGNAGNFTSALSNYLSILNNVSLDLDGKVDFTIAGWVKLDTLTGMGWVTKSQGTNVREWYGYLDINPIFVVSNNGSITVNAISSNAILAGTWYFYVGWYNATTDSIYIQLNNGVIDQVSFTGGIYNGTGAFTLGRTFTTYSGADMDGLIDEVAFWKRVLTAGERAYLYNNGNGRTYIDGKIE